MDSGIQKYLALVKTVEYGSFTKAAQVLSYSQSGVSRMIKDLENEWNVLLLERGRGGVRLTSDGLKLLPYAKQICEDHQRLQMEVDELHGLRSGIIRIGTFSSVATHWMPNIIKAFQKDYPNMEYELLLGDYTEIEGWIAEGRVDCGFLRLPTALEFDTIFLEQDDFMAILPENHPLSGCDALSLAQLCEEPFMLLEHGEKAEVSELFERNGLVPRVRFTTWDDYAIMSMVESGLGVSILPRLILRRVPYRIVAKKLDVPAYRSIGFAVRNKDTSPIAVKRFMDYISSR